MKKSFIIVGMLLVSFSVIIGTAVFRNNLYNGPIVNIYVFRGEGCPHCEKAISYLTKIKSSKYSHKINIITKEVWYNKTNQELYQKVVKKLNITQKGVPLTIIGDKYFIGFSEGTGEEMIETINETLSSSNSIDIIKDI